MRCFSLIWIMLCPLLLCGKDFSMLHYTIENGLPSNTIYDVYPDRNGFIWLATDKGISRFDGLRFKTFTTYDGIPDNEVFCITEDGKGRLWMTTYSGYVFYYEGGKFHTEANTAFLKIPLKKSMIYQTRAEKDGSITLYFLDKTAFVNIDGDQVKIYNLDKLNHLYPKAGIQLVKKISNDRYYISYPAKNVIVDTAMHILAEKNHDSLQYRVKGKSGHFFNRDTIYDEDYKPVSAIPPGFWHDRGINTIFSDQYNCFIASGIGLFINRDIELLSNFGISRVNKDNEGNYWIGTTGDGVYILSKHFRTTDFYKNVYEGTAKFAVPVNGNLFMGMHDKSLYRLSKGRSICLFDATKYVTPRSTVYRNAYMIDSNNYYAFGNQENFVVSNIDNDHPRVKRFYSVQPYARQMLCCPPNVYFTNTDFITYTTLEAIRNVKTRINEVTVRNVPDGSIYAKAASKKNVWYATIDKVFKIVDDTAVQQMQFHNTGFRLLGFYGSYMLGCTHDNRLIVYNNYETACIADTVENENCVWDKFYQLDDTHVLIATNNLYRILALFPSAGKPVYSMRVFEDPFMPLHAEYVCSNDTVCFFIKGGTVTCMPVKDMLAKPAPPTPFFLSLGSKKRNYNTDTAISISYSEARYLTISLAASSFGKQVFYEYTITKNGMNDIWYGIEGGNINAYNLGHGIYTVKLRAKTLSSDYSATTSFMLVVLKPFWAEWWFIVACIIAGAWLIVLAVRYSIRVVVNKKENEIRFLRSEYKALNALMNPHFIFNALNSVQGLINNNDKLSASEYLRTFSDLVRQNMQNVSQELIPLQKEIHLVENYLKLEKLRFKNHLHYTIKIDDTIEPDEIMIPPLLIQPLVENSVKHGLFPKQSPDSYVLVDIYEDNLGLHIEVTDNGVGLHQASLNNMHDSFGLDNIRKRIDQLSVIHKTSIQFHISEIKDDSGTVSGTRAVILMPAQETAINRS